MPRRVLASDPSERHSRVPGQAATFGEQMFGATGEDAEMQDVARALLNVPGSAAGMVGDVASAVWSPIDTAKAMGSVGLGLLFS